MAGSLWSLEETHTLLNLWGVTAIQCQLQGSKRNQPIRIPTLAVGLCGFRVQQVLGTVQGENIKPDDNVYSVDTFQVRT